MRKTIITLALILSSSNIYGADPVTSELMELKERVAHLEKQIELIDQMVAQNTELVKTNRKLNRQLGQLMKVLHPKDLAGMNP